MTAISVEILLVVFLVALNGIFPLSEMAIVAARKARIFKPSPDSFYIVWDEFPLPPKVLNGKMCVLRSWTWAAEELIKF